MIHHPSSMIQERTGLEAQHASKINAEINRYQAMVQEKEELSRKWDEEVCVRGHAAAEYSHHPRLIPVIDAPSMTHRGV